MKRTLRLRPAVLVPGLFVLYLLITGFAPSPFAAILPGVAVVIAARVWEVKGGLLTAVATVPCLVLGFFALDNAPAVRAALGDHTFLEGWLVRLYVLLWFAMLALGIYVGSLTRQTRVLDQVNADLSHAQQRLTALHQIALSLSTTLDVGRLLETILEQLGHLWGYDHGAILLLDESTGELVVQAARGYVCPPCKRIPANSGICGTVLQTGTPLFVSDVAGDPRYIPGVKGARSELAVPLVWEGKILGVLNVESQTPGTYGQADLDLLTTVAEQAAAAIGNAALHEKTRNLAISDPHTGLFNYRHFQDQVAAHVRDAQLTNQPVSLLMLDMDHFKRVNDTYGHPTGDHVLGQIAKALRESCREEDLVFRYGGEEFAVLLPGRDEQAADLIGERIRERVALYPFTTRSARKLDFPMTVSVGVATYPQDALTAVDLVLAADKALYAAKAAGRNRVVKAAPGTHADTA